MNIEQKFGKKIKINRVGRDLTVEQLAEKANLGTTTITSIEKGSSSPTLDTISKLATALGIPLNEILMFDDVEKFL